MWRAFILGLAASMGACAPAPVRMPAAEASEVLELFAVGRGPADLCSAEGRAMLRGAVRAYSGEMSRAGMAWPLSSGGEHEDAPGRVEASVLIAFAAGFIEASDFRGANHAIGGALAQWPEIQAMRTAAEHGCEDWAALQQAAARLVVELERHQRLAERVERGHGDANQLQRQARRIERARVRMNDAAAGVQAQPTTRVEG